MQHSLAQLNLPYPNLLYPRPDLTDRGTSKRLNQWYLENQTSLVKMCKFVAQLKILHYPFN
jgi:hypothetical protein